MCLASRPHLDPLLVGSQGGKPLLLGAFAWILSFLTWGTPPSHAFRCQLSILSKRLSLGSRRLSALLSCQFSSHHMVTLSLNSVTEGITPVLLARSMPVE